MGQFSLADSVQFALIVDTAQTANAIAVAASLAGGLVANFGTMTKPLHVGRTAQAGALASVWPKAALPARPMRLSTMPASCALTRHPVSPRSPAAIGSLGDGGGWKSSASISSGIRCAMARIVRSLDLVNDHDLDAASIDSIDVRIGDTQGLMLCNHNPGTGLEAKSSMEFAMASLTVARRVGLKELTDSFVTRDDVKSVMRKVRVSTTQERMADMPFAPDRYLRSSGSGSYVLNAAGGRLHAEARTAGQMAAD
jgi:2-methylcitrate dehydratase PrpD